MVIKDIERFEEFARACGNKYLAVRWLSYWSRCLGQQYKQYRIEESKLLQWVLTGRCPYSNIGMELRKFHNSNNSELDEYLEWVLDNEVKDAVRDAYKQSIQSRHLLYYSNDKLGVSRVSRVNILLRMIWYSVST